MKKRSGSPLRGRRDGQLAGLLFALPFLLGILLVFVRILASSVSFAFADVVPSETGYDRHFNGLDNFVYALRVDPEFIRLLTSAISSLAASIPMILVVSLFIAVVLNGRIPGRTFFRAVFFLPVIVSTGLVSRLDMSNLVMSGVSKDMDKMAGSGGLAMLGDISQLLEGLNFSPSIIDFVSGAADNITGTISLSGVQILIFLAGIQSISPSVYEAADVEGATAWEKFWKITLPMVTPMIVVNLVYTVIDYLTRDDTALMQYVRSVAFVRGQQGPASAMAWIFTLCVTGLFLLVCLAVFFVRRNRAGRAAYRA